MTNLNPKVAPAAVVIAGGMARRLGSVDKSLLDIGGVPILTHIVRALRADAGHIAISANGDPARFAAFGLPVLPDGAFAGQGPLAGLLAGMEWAAGLGVDVILSVPGDTPFIPVGLWADLSPAPSLAVSDGRAHSLVGLWPVSARAVLRTLLSAPGQRRVEAFANKLGARRVAFPLPGYDPFLNVNTPEQLEAARRIRESQP